MNDETELREEYEFLKYYHDDFVSQLSDMLKAAGVVCEPTGAIFSFGGTQYKIGYKNNEAVLWSPPWSELEEREKALLAQVAFITGSHE